MRTSSQPPIRNPVVLPDGTEVFVYREGRPIVDGTRADFAVTKPNLTNDTLLNIVSIARILGVNERTVRRWRKRRTRLRGSRRPFPPPDRMAASHRPEWRWSTIRTWAIKSGMSKLL